MKSKNQGAELDSKSLAPFGISSMKPWLNASDAELNRVRGVCLDIDDTLSSSGKLTSEAFSALWALKNAGFRVVPITGRPAGWCDHIARFWPVDAVVGENGAFTFFMEAGRLRRINTVVSTEDPSLRLGKLRELILKRFPKACFASDQRYREFDLAIDIREDVPAWSTTEIEELIHLCTEAGAHAKLSSIHVNTWFGDYDKKLGLEAWRRAGCPGLPKGECPKNWDEWIYIGDSPNDEPMFAFFKLSVGVANLLRYQNNLKSPPRWITSKESGSGFAEMAKRLLAARTKSP